MSQHKNDCDLVGWQQGYNAPAVCSCGAEDPGVRPAPAINAEKELALIQEAVRDASLSDGAVRAIAAGTVEPTPDDIAWAQSELRRADPAQEREP